MSELVAGDLLARAKAETGLSDWGDDSFEERFGLAIKHINSIPMDDAGRLAADKNCLWHLTDRLKFMGDRKLYPLGEEVIDRPMFATGEPRPQVLDGSQPVAEGSELPDSPYIAAGLKVDGRLMLIPDFEQMKKAFYP